LRQVGFVSAVQPEKVVRVNAGGTLASAAHLLEEEVSDGEEREMLAECVSSVDVVLAKASRASVQS
jgi:hypothetical protein